MDTETEPCMIIHKQGGGIIKFREHDDGLYVFDTHLKSPEVPILPCTLVQTVAQNKEHFVSREIEQADKARDLYRKLGRPSQQKFEDIISKNVITNCPITVDDARRAHIIYGPDLATLKGKTTTGPPTAHVPSFQAVPIPSSMLDHHSRVTLCVDFFFVQGQAFIHFISRKIQHRVVEPVANRSKSIIIKHINKVFSLYRSRGFTIVDLHCDNEFECIRNDILPVNLNVVAADSHVGEVERSIRTIKERNRSTVHGLPYKRLPKLMVREIVKHSVTCLNQLPADDGVSTALSPNTILTGRPNPDFNHLRLEFGLYVQIFEPTTFATNTLRSRTTGAITLTHTGNAQGDYYFMLLITGRRLSRHQYTVVPITDATIERVEQLAALEDQPWVQSSGLLVEWRPHLPFDDDDDPDFVYTPEVDDDDDDDYFYDDTTADDVTVATGHISDLDALTISPSVTTPVVTTHIAASAPNHAAHDVPHHEADLAPYHEADLDTYHEADLDTHHEADLDTYHEADLDPYAEANSVPDHNTDPYSVSTFSDNYATAAEDEFSVAAPSPPPYNLRPSRARSYAHRLDHIMDSPHDSQSYEPTQLFQQSTRHIITAYVFTQMSAAKGIKVYGDPAVAAIQKEFCQLHNKGVFEPQHASSLTAAQKRASLRAVNLIKEKRTGELKGRTCAGGSVQRSLYDKSETTSPTVATDALMYTILIDAKERRDVATADVVGAYLNADMDQFTLMKLTGDAVNIMIQVDTSYAKYVSHENNKPVLYLQLKKAQYGCVRSALLWYELFANTLFDMGFELNPYDSCVANKIIEGTQCTVAWYVDDNKISHKNPQVVTRVIEQIEERFDFHSVVAKLLYVSLRARPDILLAVSFLCTRVSKSTK
jgi:Reverse transcriptase (RNA-dependent DNA polymerase)